MLLIVDLSLLYAKVAPELLQGLPDVALKLHQVALNVAYS